MDIVTVLFHIAIVAFIVGVVCVGLAAMIAAVEMFTR